MTVTFDRIRLENGVLLTPTPFSLYYKELTDTSWTLIDTNVYVDLDGYITSSPLPSITIADAGYYVFRAVNDFCGIDYQQNFIVYDSNLYEWVEDDNYCQQDSPLNLLKNITGFADPVTLGYDEITSRMYVVDCSAITQGSNIYYFDVDTITVAGDVTPVGSLNVAAIASVFDAERRKIYISGPDTNGLIVYDIALDSSTVIPFGTNGSYARISLRQFGTNIICIDQFSELVTIVDADTLTIVQNIAYTSIPSYALRFSGAPVAWLVGDKWWVIASQDADFGVPSSSIGIYSFDFTSLEGTIPLPGNALWTNSAYWRIVSEIDGLLFIYDCGSNQLVTVGLSDQVVTSRYTFTNREGKTNSAFSITQDSVSFEIYASGNWVDDANTDLSPIQITYKLDSSTFTPDTIYPAQAYGVNLTREGSNDVLVGAYDGIRVYPTTPVGSATDGEINIFTKGGVGDNTGMKIVLTLQEVNTVTGVPTGDTKTNTIGDPDYIAPYEDLINCAPTYTLECPTTTYTPGTPYEYEFSLIPSTYNNPALLNMVIEQIDTVTTGLLASSTVPKNMYQHGYITKIGANPNRIDLIFKDASNNTIGTCSDLFTIP